MMPWWNDVVVVLAEDSQLPGGGCLAHAGLSSNGRTALIVGCALVVVGLLIVIAARSRRR